MRCRKSPEFGIDVGRSIFRNNCFIVGWDLVKDGQKPQWYSSIDKVAFRLIQLVKASQGFCRHQVFVVPSNYDQ